MKKNFQLLLLTGWLIPAALALVFFGKWIVDIVVPTLKGGDFNALYDLHGVRYLDVTLLCVIVAFCWAALAVFRGAKVFTSANPA